MAVFKATENKKGSLDSGKFKATNRKSYDSTMVYDWETKNKESISTLNNYYTKINNGEFLTADDITAYRSALDNYISSSNSLRGINKSFGGTYSEEEEKNWTDSVSLMQTDYDNASKFYSSFKNEDKYKDYLAGVKRREEQKTFDLVAGKAEIEDLQVKAETKKSLEKQINTLNAQLNQAASVRDTAKVTELNTQLSELRKQYAEYGDTDYNALLAEKRAYYGEAERLQNSTKLTDEAKNSEDFDIYSQQGANIKNPTLDEAWGGFSIGSWRPFGEDVGNIVTFSREYADEELAGIEGNNSPRLTNDLYGFMTEEEVSIYNYYLAKEGKEKASEYLSAIEGDLTARQASGMVDNIGDNGFLKVAFGFAAGIDQFASGVKNLITDKDYYSSSASQMASAEIRDSFDTGFGQVVYDLANTTGNMLPSILVGSVFGGGVGNVAMGLSAMGNAKAEMINLGYTKDQATAYGVLVGASEAGLQYLLGGISALGGKASGGLIEKVLTKVDNAFARTAIKLGGSMLSEGFEESLQTILEPWFKSIVTGVDFEAADVGEVLYSGLLGALSAGLLEGAGTIGGEVSTYKSGKLVQNVGAVDRLTKLGSTFAADSVAYKLASKVDENTGAYTIGRLLNEVDATLTEQNKSEIVKSLVRKGMSTEDANIQVKWLNEVVEGAELTDAQALLLDSNDVLSRTFHDVIINENSTVNQRNKAYAEAVDMVNKGVSATKATNGSKTIETPKTEIPSAESETKVEGEKTDLSKAKTTYEGNEVSIKEVSSIKDGEVFVHLNDGREVNAKEVDFNRSEDGLIYEHVANMNEQTAQYFIDGFNKGNIGGGKTISFEEYMRGFDEAYKNGSLGIPYYALSKDGFASTLSETQRKIAYNRGRIDSVAKVEAKQKGLNEKKTTVSKTENIEKKKGKVYFEKGVHAKNNRQKTSIKALQVLADALGVDIHIFESATDANGKRSGKNGWFDPSDNSIHIDLYAGADGKSTILFTAAHELTHFIREWSPKKFKTFADFLLAQYGARGVSVEQLVQSQIDKAKRNGRDIDFDTAYEEVIADACESMLTDSNAIKKLAMLKAKDRGLVNKIKTFIDNLVEKIKKAYAKLAPDSVEGQLVRGMVDVAKQLQDLWTDALVDAGETYQTIGTRDLSEFTEAKNTNGEVLFQYRAMEADQDAYKAMLLKHGIMSESEIDSLFETIDKAVDVIKNNLEALDYAWDVDIDDRAFMPIKPNSDSLYQVSLDFSTLCRKRLLQQTIQATLQDALNKPLSKEEGIAIRDELMKIQEEGRQIEIACALCYVESARMKSPTQIKKFLNNRESVIKDFFAGKAGGSTKEKIARADADARNKIHRENPEGIKAKDGTMVDPRTASLKEMPKKYADMIRSAKKEAKLSYQPTAEQQRLIDVAMNMTTSDFTSPEGLANLAKNYRELFDAYTSFVRNATKSKGIEKDTWWRAGDSDGLIGQALIDKMNAENGLRSQSWSDFQVIHLLDYIAATIELSTKNTKRQSYTKVPDYVILLGRTGDMINMSLITTRTYSGSLEYDPVEGMDYDTAKKLREKYHETAGTICIGIDNAQIKQLLADGTIDYVIPYHKSGMSAATRKLMHIPEWTDYESYQSESTLSIEQAKANAKKYGVQLLDKSDSNYQKHTNFSDWFDISVARQIAKMENANPSDLAMQEKYGVMYGAYKAMQSAANDYLKLCAERGIAPKFSHSDANFTVEENYWKLLIDRKMIDNVTGEIIEQKAIKPIFDEADILGILNRELERYPQVKADQEYATRKVVEKFLSGEMKIDKDTRDAIQKPIDNISNVNIVASSENIKNSDRDSDGKTLSKEQQEFFKDSKVRNKDGNLLVVYHGSPRKFTVFDSRKVTGYKNNFNFFTPDKEYSEGVGFGGNGTVYKVYLNIQNPYYLNADGQKLGELDFDKDYWHNNEKVVGTLISHGYDGLIVGDKYFPDEIISFNSNQIKLTTNKTPTDNPDIRYSDRYSYESLTSKPDMKLTTIDNVVEHKPTTTMRKTAVDTALKNAKAIGKTDSTGAVSVYVDDIGSDVILSRKSLEHGFDRRFSENLPATLKAGEILKNAIRINELKPKIKTAESAYVLIGSAINKNGDLTVVEFVVNEFTNEVASIDVLYSVNAKKEEAVLNAPPPTNNSLRITSSSKISIAELLEFVNRFYPDILPKPVYEHFGHTERPKGKLGESALYSERDPELAEHREKVNKVLARENAKLKEDNQYLKELVKLQRKQTHGAKFTKSSVQVVASKLMKSINASGNKSELVNLLNNFYEHIAESKHLAWEEIAEKAQPAVNWLKEHVVNKADYEYAEAMVEQDILLQVYDGYWNVSTLHTVADSYQKEINLLKHKHHKKIAELREYHNKKHNQLKKEYQDKITRIKSEYRERNAKTTRELMTRYQESIAKAAEGRHKTEMRHKIKKVVNELNKLLLRPTKDKHVKEELQRAVAEALWAINMDTVVADDRVAKYNDLIAKATDPDVIQELTDTRDRIQFQGENLKDKLDALKSSYEKIKNSKDVELSNAYQEVVLNSINNTLELVGDTPIRYMSLEQLEAVYEMYKMVLHTVRTANKMFKESKYETLVKTAEAVNAEVRLAGGEHYKRTVIGSTLTKIGWTFLKPFTAFRTIGSKTLTGLYNNLRLGEDTYYVDIKEAQDFIKSQYEKHNFSKWDMKQTKEFTAKSGKTFSLTLEQMMSIFAYSRREQAKAHLLEGGIVLDDAVTVTEKNKLGLPVKYEVTTKNAFNLSEGTLLEIIDSLTDEQKAFVKEMQSYLSDVMGAKGNEISMEMYGIKLFKEVFYFPIKSSKDYMGFKPEEAGEIKLKNPSFSKETVKHANNPVVLSNFTDVWANHVNDMAMYHSFVLPLEDFTRVFNYKTRTDAKTETMSTEATIANAYGKGATEYIRNFLRSLNGGVRVQGTPVDKFISRSKKGAVLASASVTIQQPSAVMRAMAYINPKYFVKATPDSLNLVNHKKDWAEIKQYAPIAGIKEMGHFDIGLGQSTVDWIKSNKTTMEKVDDVLSAAPAYMDEVTWVSIWQAVKREVLDTTDLKFGTKAYLEKVGERFTEVVSLSQVYDSVFARSDLMRNPNPLAKMITSFMAEPSTTMNMLFDSWVQAKRTGKKKPIIITSGAIGASIIFNSMLKSIIGAMRDDDEDESYIEKYIESFVGNVQDGFNPLTYIPVLKDLWSLWQGYDVSRMDMDLFADFMNALKAFGSESKTDYEKWSGLVGAVSAFFGVPIKNIERDIRGFINTIESLFNGEKTTSAGIWNSIREGWSGKEISKTQQLYEAYLSGDQEQIKRIEGRFKDQADIEAALRKALRENDPRIREAAQAVIDGNHEERIRITKEIKAEGHFKQDIIVAAINAELTALRREMSEAKNKN